MKISIDGVAISFDETIQDLVPISYTGRVDKIEEIKRTLFTVGGKYGNGFNPDYCIAIDLIIALGNHFKVKVDPTIKFYDPPIPDGCIP